MNSQARKVGESRGRKPAALVAAQARGQSTGQDAIWEAMRALQVFTTQQLWLAVEKRRGGNIYTIRSYVARLLKAGYLAVESTVTRGSIVTRTYRLVRNVGVDAPRLTKDGRQSTAGLQFEQMWTAMRRLADFNHRDLAIYASTDQVTVHEEHAKHYVAGLNRAGYLVLTEAGKHSVSLSRFRLNPTMNTGPKPPLLQKLEAVYDRNLRRVVWQQNGGEA